MKNIYTAIETVCTCPFCHKNVTILVPAQGYRRWQMGELIQNALPTLTVAEREMLVTGMCPDCQEDFYNSFEDEDEEDEDEEEVEW